MGKNVSDIWEKIAMSKGYQNWASEVAYFIDFDFTIFAMFKTCALNIADLDFLSDEKKHWKDRIYLTVNNCMYVALLESFSKIENIVQQG